MQKLKMKRMTMEKLMIKSLPKNPCLLERNEQVMWTIIYRLDYIQQWRSDQNYNRIVFGNSLSRCIRCFSQNMIYTRWLNMEWPITTWTFKISLPAICSNEEAPPLTLSAMSWVKLISFVFDWCLSHSQSRVSYPCCTESRLWGEHLLRLWPRWVWASYETCACINLCATKSRQISFTYLIMSVDKLILGESKLIKLAHEIDSNLMIQWFHVFHIFSMLQIEGTPLL